MGKIHTHYDNLKVARGAPQEVIRAAYKALSQKYHPDKNPGDEVAEKKFLEISEGNSYDCLINLNNSVQLMRLYPMKNEEKPTINLVKKD